MRACMRFVLLSHRLSRMAAFRLGVDQGLRVTALAIHLRALREPAPAARTPCTRIAAATNTGRRKGWRA